MHGYFVTLEGGEGAGKSTQARLLAQALRDAGHAVVATREPGGAPGAEILRRLLLDPDAAWSLPAETLLHFAARAEHVERTIRPALTRGDCVVCDRFADSTMAYQGYALGGDRAAIAALADMIHLRPDLTLVLDVAVGTSVARLAGRGRAADRYEREGEAFFARIRDAFRAIAATDPVRCALISAEGPPEAVAARIREAVRARLGLAL
jgi:dTMP kinase